MSRGRYVRKIPDRPSRKTTMSSNNKIGKPLGIHDKDGREICVGDVVIKTRPKDEYKGRVLYNDAHKKYEIFLEYSMWYGDDPFNPHCYGKVVPISMDDGEKPNLVRLSSAADQS